jgi:NAD(P)-dependent dehydrogenase (short-subunit alcohol dehydrogenase family)
MKWIITGARSGLGRAMAEAALGRGDTVVGVIRGKGSAEDFEKIAPGRSIAAIADVTDRRAVFDVIATAERITGGVDVLVNCAANALESYIEEAEPGEVRKLFECNLLGPLHAIQAILPYMRARARGHIINVSSMGGVIGVPWVGFYSTTKFALEGMSEALAREVGPLGISVTILEPGGFRTEMLNRQHFEKTPAINDYAEAAGQIRARIKATAGKEAGDPAKLAQAVLKIVASKEPPLRVALGDDAIEAILGKIQQMKEDIEAWRGIGTNLNFDGYLGDEGPLCAKHPLKRPHLFRRLRNDVLAFLNR